LVRSKIKSGEAELFCHAERLHIKQTRGMTTTKNGLWTGCGQRQYTPSRQQPEVAHDKTAGSLIPLHFPTLSLSVQPVWFEAL